MTFYVNWEKQEIMNKAQYEAMMKEIIEEIELEPEYLAEYLDEYLSTIDLLLMSEEKKKKLLKEYAQFRIEAEDWEEYEIED